MFNLFNSHIKLYKLIVTFTLRQCGGDASTKINKIVVYNIINKTLIFVLFATTHSSAGLTS